MVEYISSFEAPQLSSLMEPPMAHVSATIGHHILLFGGYRISYENDLRTITAFDKKDILTYDLLNHKLDTLEVQYDLDPSISFPTEFFFSSGMACATNRNRVYLFGGYSLTQLDAGNALYYVEISNNDNKDDFIDVGRVCDEKIKARLVFLTGSHAGSTEEEHNIHPSFRDKASMVYWEKKLIVFGGYGCHFRGSESGEHRPHDFLGAHGEFVIGSGNRGWTNQLLMYSVADRQWTNPQTNGPVPCPRAAHSSAISGNKMFIFGGRLGIRNTAATIRCNQLYHLDLKTLSWSQVRLDDSGLVGRSWTSFTPLSSHHFFIVGGFSGENVPLSDAHVISIDNSQQNGTITNMRACMERASWDPCMDASTWNTHELLDPVCRMWHSTSKAPDGRIYIIGGCRNNLLFEVEKIQTVVERVRASPDSLYSLCLWALVNRRQILPRALLSTAIVNDIMTLML